MTHQLLPGRVALVIAGLLTLVAPYESVANLCPDCEVPEDAATDVSLLQVATLIKGKGRSKGRSWAAIQGPYVVTTDKGGLVTLEVGDDFLQPGPRAAGGIVVGGVVVPVAAGGARRGQGVGGGTGDAPGAGAGAAHALLDAVGDTVREIVGGGNGGAGEEEVKFECRLSQEWGGWEVGKFLSWDKRYFPASQASEGRVSCELPPLAVEGPVKLTLAATSVKRRPHMFSGSYDDDGYRGPRLLQSEPVTVWYSSPLAVSFDQRPYFAAGRGELLVRTNVTESDGVLLVSARTVSPSRSARGGASRVGSVPGEDWEEDPAAEEDAPWQSWRRWSSTGQVEKQDREQESVELLPPQTVNPRGHNVIPVSFGNLSGSFDGMVEVKLVDAESGDEVARRLVRLTRVPKRRRGSSAVDFKRRSLIVDGRPFFPISWFSTYLSFGADQLLESLRDMSRHGVNSVMLYNLVEPESIRFPDRRLPLPKHVLDAAAALGIKVHVYLVDLADPLTSGRSQDFGPLLSAVRDLKDHPAVLSWYIADDSAGSGLPEVYRRIKRVDPYHMVSIALMDPVLVEEEHYQMNADLFLMESYDGEPEGGFMRMNVMNRYPMEFAPAMHCGRAWAAGQDGTGGDISVNWSPEMFRAQLYMALIAGSTGEVWFAYRNSDGWNEPGIPLHDAGGAAAREIMDLVPSLLSTGSYDPKTRMPPVSASSFHQDGRPGSSEHNMRARAWREPSGCVTLLVANGLAEPMEAVVKFPFGSPGIYDALTNRSEANVPFEKGPEPGRRVAVVQGELREWLPSNGVQVFQFSCDAASFEPLALLGTNASVEQNGIWNPSFETSQAYIAAPDGWECGMRPGLVGESDSSCFADTHLAIHGRHSGRFITGASVSSFRIRPTLAGHVGSRPGIYEGSVWAQADSPMSLAAVQMSTQDNDADIVSCEHEVASVDLSNEWRQLRFRISLPEGTTLAFKATHPGVLWLDGAELRFKEHAAEAFDGCDGD